MVRIALVLLSLVSGVGVAGYVLAWLLVPLEGEEQSVGALALGDVRGIALALSVTPALVVVLLLALALHVGWLSSFGWSLFLAVAGLILVWRNAPEEEREVMRWLSDPLVHLGRFSPGSRRSLLGRVVAGLALLLGGLSLLVEFHGGSTVRPLIGVGLAMAGVIVIFGPWWLTLAHDLVEERQARVRAEARADMAARIHDSVLQTLALIQKNAGQSQRVIQLARAQERELRSWLSGESAANEQDATLSAAIHRIEREVEASHGVPIETVIVGDCPLDDNLRALVDATREAVVNAAKWSGAAVISLYLEVGASEVSLFVRDRGVGFDAAAVGADRRGIAESVVGRMSRHGGSALIRSAPGEGTEVELRTPLTGARPRPRNASV